MTIVNYDELAETVHDQATALAALHGEAGPLRAELDWYDGTDPDAAIVDAAAEVERRSSELHAARMGLAAATDDLKTQRVLWVMSWHPTALLVSRVRSSRKLLRQARAEVAELTAKESELQNQHRAARAALEERQAEKARYEAFDRPAAALRLKVLDTAIDEARPDHEERTAQLAAIDEELSPLLADLQRVKDELRRGNLRSPQANRLRGIEERLEKRIRQVKRKGTMVVRRVIIDGSNLRFDDTNSKIGLFALRPLCAELLKTAEVLVVFDATILRQLGYPDNAALEAAMPGVPVKLASSKTDADELILRLAEDETTYVLSNDSFPEYMSTAALREDRVLAVEIVDSLRLVCVLMLDLKVSYGRSQTDVGVRFGASSAS